MARSSIIRESKSSVKHAAEIKDKIIDSISSLLDEKLKQLYNMLDLLIANEGCELEIFKRLRSTCNGFDNVYRLGYSLIEDLFDDYSSSESACTEMRSQQQTNEKSQQQNNQQKQNLETSNPEKENGKNLSSTKPEANTTYQNEKRPKEAFHSRMVEATNLLPKMKLKKQFDAMFVHGTGPGSFCVRSTAEATKYVSFSSFHVFVTEILVD